MDDVDAAFGVGQSSEEAQILAAVARTATLRYEQALRSMLKDKGLGWTVSELALACQERGWNGDYRTLVTVLNRLDHLKATDK